MNSLAVGAIGGIILATAVYVAFALVELRRTKTFREYFFSNWDLDSKDMAASIFSSAMSLATVIIALIQLSFIFGIGLSWAIITFCAGWAVYQFAGVRIRQLTSPRETLHLFLGRVYESTLLKSIASCATIIGMLGLFATELFAVDMLVRALGFSHTVGTIGILLFGGIAIFHAAYGGFRSVVHSDRYQSILLIITLPLLLALAVWFWYSHGHPTPAATAKSQSFLLPLSVLLGLFMINTPFPYVDTLAWQRARAAASDRAFQRGNLRALIGFAITWSSLVAIGILLASILPNGTDPFLALFEWIALLPAPIAFLSGLLIMPGFISAMLSSSDAFLNSANHSFNLDFTSARDAADDAPIAGASRRYVFVLGLLGLLLTVGLRSIGFQIVDMIFAVYAGTLSLLPAVTVSLYARNRNLLPRLRLAALVAAIGGFLAAWINGFYSIAGISADTRIGSWLALHVPRDVYQSPTYAFVVSILLFILFTPLALAVTKMKVKEEGIS